MEPGDIVGDRFELEETVASGGMGTVHRARDRRTGKLAALKAIRPETDLRARFLREAEVLASLAHPGIVQYLAHGVEPDGTCWLGMEWLEGPDLRERIEREPLALGESVAMARRVAEALGAAHAAGIVHRDVKPANVVLEFGNARRSKLVDFGIASQRGTGATLTQLGVVMGTVGYMAPEQARGEPDLDARVDVFALGCVLYECLTGRAAFDGDEVVAVLAKILFEDPPSPGTLVEGIPPALDELVLRLMARDRSLRPADGAAVVQEIDALGTLEGSGRARASVAPPSLGAGEQRLVCVVVAGGANVEPTIAQARGHRITLDDLGQRPDLAPVLAALEPFGARIEALANGAVVATLSGGGAATDLAARAARCALALQSLLGTDGRRPPIALATGRGDTSQRVPVGEAIDRAASLLRAARADGAGHVRLDEVTAGLLDPTFVTTGDAHGLLLLGVRPETEAARTVLGRPTPFVGREREAALLEGIFAESVEEAVPRVALVTAEPGLGKTRLAAEVVERLRARDASAEIWLGRGDPMSAGSSFGLLSRLLRRLSGLVDGEPVDVARRKLRARISRSSRGEAAREIADFLGELVAVPSDEETAELRAARRDAMLMGDRIRHAFESFLVAEARLGPIVLVLDDLHWGDLPTVQAIDAALRNTRDGAVTVLGLGRPELLETFPKLWADRARTLVELSPVGKRSAERLVRAVLGDAVDERALQRMVERAEGNPFFLEELVRAHAAGQATTPETVLAMVQARLEGLPGPARRLLRAAAVFGQACPRAGLDVLVGRLSDLDARLVELTSHELLEVRPSARRPAETEIAFRHGVVREAAYAMLTDEDRALGHRLAGEWLERAGEREASVLGEHFERGGDRPRAAHWYRRAAEQAIEGGDLVSAIARAEQSLTCAGQDAPERAALLLLTAEAHRWRGSNADAERCALSALSGCTAGTREHYGALIELFMASGRLGRAESMMTAAEALLDVRVHEPPELVADRAIAEICAAATLLSAGKYELATRLLDALDDLPSELVDTHHVLGGRLAQARALRARFEGDLGAHLRYNLEAAAAYRRAGDLRNGCRQLIGVGYANLQLGAFSEAVSALRDAIVFGERLGLGLVIAGAQHNLGLALGALGETDEARAVETSALRWFQAQDNRWLEGGCHLYLAEIELGAGQLDAAESAAARACVLLEPSPPSHAYASAVHAMVLLARRRGDAAMVAAERARALLEELGSVDEGEAVIRLAYAEALDAVGEGARARAAFALAAQRLLSRAERIEDDELRLSFLERVPVNRETMARAAALGLAAG